MMYGFFRVAAASPQVKVAHVSFHAQRIISCVKAASRAGVGLLVFPELSLTAYTCGDLFFSILFISRSTTAAANRPGTNRFYPYAAGHWDASGGG